MPDIHTVTLFGGCATLECCMKNEMLMVSRNLTFSREVNFHSVNINILMLLSFTILSESYIYKNKLSYCRAGDTLVSKTQNPESSFSRNEDVT